VKKTPAAARTVRSGTLTGQAEDYLKAIYEMEQGGEPAATNAVAALLGIAPASVSGMLQRLSRLGLVHVERYRGARLTHTGRRAALQLIRRHRIIESYLVTRLGFGWDEVDEEAERLEHGASTELVERMAAALGHPTEDPHGAPIPTSDGLVDERRLLSIADLAVGQTARVVRVSDRDSEFLRYLAAMGIRPNATVKVADRAPFDGPVTITVRGARHQLGVAAASRVYVEPVARTRRAAK
jgi:DtxR family Mn-dependent transcriptional regulator